MNSNWADMVMTTLAWNLKAWFALLVPDCVCGLELLKMEFLTFLQAIVALLAQIVRTARKLVCRLLGYNRWLKVLLTTFIFVGVILDGTDWPTKMSALRIGGGSAGASPYHPPPGF